MKKYKSRIGIENLIIFGLLCIFNFYTLFEIEFQNKMILLTVVLLMFCPIIICWFGLKTTSYVIDENSLHIKSSFFYKEKIDINNIRKIQELTNITSAPAASIKRLEIAYNKYDSIMISPKNQDQFIQDILVINNQIQVNLK